MQKHVLLFSLLILKFYLGFFIVGSMKTLGYTIQYNEILASQTFDVAVAFYTVIYYTVIFPLPVDFAL